MDLMIAKVPPADRQEARDDLFKQLQELTVNGSGRRVFPKECTLVQCKLTDVAKASIAPTEEFNKMGFVWNLETGHQRSLL